MGDVRIIKHKNGSTIGYSVKSGVTLIESDGLMFKDLNRNGELDRYEDWRLSIDERARDLASQMSIEQIAGLMLYSGHQAIPELGSRHQAVEEPLKTYGGKLYKDAGVPASAITDEQMQFLVVDNLRHVLITKVESPRVAAEWNNNVQALVEGLGLGIPANNSSDPRHASRADAEYNEGSGGHISTWPGSLGLAATFDPALVRRFGQIASEEYRALGIATALSPQIDLATDPRWNRSHGSFGEDPVLCADLTRAYIDGFQTSTGKDVVVGNWGMKSVNAMVKHWPGGGSGEAGRDAHFGYGKYAVYPGNNFKDHIYPFTEGAFKLHDGTGMASAVMPYYTVSYKQDPSGKELGNGFSKYIITDLLRDKYNYDGVVCTDWIITHDQPGVGIHAGKPWGVEKLNEAERHYVALMAGIDQFGGNNVAAPIIEAYAIGSKEHGEEFMRARFEKSAVRLLRNIFRTGLFENPYLDPDRSAEVVGNPGFMKEAYEAQVKSIVMLKNHENVLPLKKETKVYMPKRYYPALINIFTDLYRNEAYEDYPIQKEQMAKYFTTVDSPEEADCAIVFILSPESGPGFSYADVKKGDNGYVPISLQYRPYKAVHARAKSIAGGDQYEKFTNRTYKNKMNKTVNESDLDSILATKAVMKDKPVIVLIGMAKPTIMAEFEGSVDAILVGFDVSNQAYLDILSGKSEPSGLLPMQMPRDMKTVELQLEDVPFDVECYEDADGNVYDYAYGMNWKGVINDSRVEKYKRK
uniref:beta-glucosidase n=1 Tax=uncultured bacterium contig00113(2014) TaxID=1465633 RepID=A0A060D274_9BACT|nr:hypothetical protein [uncultured bacterium contig00113(2014)]